jgi:hypothetical protein
VRERLRLCGRGGVRERLRLCGHGGVSERLRLCGRGGVRERLRFSRRGGVRERLRLCGRGGVRERLRCLACGRIGGGGGCERLRCSPPLSDGLVDGGGGARASSLGEVAIWVDRLLESAANAFTKASLGRRVGRHPVLQLVSSASISARACSHRGLDVVLHFPRSNMHARHVIDGQPRGRFPGHSNCFCV